MHGELYSITVKIAPLSAMFFKAKNIRTPEDDIRKALAKRAKSVEKSAETKPTAKVSSKKPTAAKKTADKK